MMEMHGRTEASEALRRALRCLEEGHWDGRSLEGAKANALESIAWSLVGLLAQQETEGPRQERTLQQTLSHAFMQAQP